MEPDLKDLGGVFEKSKDAQFKIWVTSDKRRIPIRIKRNIGENMNSPREGLNNTPSNPSPKYLSGITPWLK